MAGRDGLAIPGVSRTVKVVTTTTTAIIVISS